MTIRAEGDELVLRDARGRDRRVPTARRDPAAGVPRLAVVGEPYRRTPIPPEQPYVDHLVGLTAEGRRVFDTELGWPVGAVRTFAGHAGLRFDGQRDLAMNEWPGAYPPVPGAVRLRSMSPAYRRLLVGIFALAALAGVAAAVVQMVLAVT